MSIDRKIALVLFCISGSVLTIAGYLNGGMVDFLITAGLFSFIAAWAFLINSLKL